MVLYILLPAFNEERNISQLIPDLELALRGTAISYQIIIVDDGSRDGSVQTAEELARRYPITLLRHPANQGYAEAIKTGFSYVLSKGMDSDLLITMDCDNTHPPNYIVDMMSEIQKGYDIVIASRYQKEGGQIGFTLRRRLLSKAASFLLHGFFPLSGVRDYTSGYRIYRLTILKKGIERYGSHFIQSEGFSASMEILLKLRPIGVKVSEIPLILRYDLKNGTSKMRVIRTIKGYSRVIWNLERSHWRNQSECIKVKSLP